MIKHILKGILAGIVIALASLAYGLLLNQGLGYKIAGAFIFSFGLLAVVD